MEKKEYTYKSSNGKTNIFTREWRPKGEIKAIIQIAHGVTEHSGRYEKLAEFFVSNGIMVVANDHIGHGYSQNDDGSDKMSFGSKGSWRYAVEDVANLSMKYKQEYPQTPLFVLGFSLGSFLVRTVLIDYPQINYDGAILAGTGQQNSIAIALGSTIAKSEAKKYGDSAFTEKVDKLTFDNYNKCFKPVKTRADWLCSNQKAIEDYLADSLVGKGFTAGLFRELLSGMKYTNSIKNISKMNKEIKVLFISGLEDPVGEFGKGVKKAQIAFQKAGVKNLDLYFVNGRHDIFHEDTKEEVFEKILKWVNI